MNKMPKIETGIKKDILESILTGRLYYSKIPNPNLEEIELKSNNLEEIEKEIDKIIWNDNFTTNSYKKFEKKETMRKIKKIMK